MNKLAKAIATWTLVVALAFMGNSADVFAKSKSPVEVECNDTIAGYGSEIEVATLKETSLSFMLETPTGRKVFLQETSNEDGMLTLQVADYHLQTAGDYYASARFTERNEEFGDRCSFTVYPGDVSEIKSQISTNRKTAEAGPFESIVTEVRLLDDFGNAVKGHSVELISSRTEDDIQFLSKLPYTDDNGVVAFLVSSENPGMSTFSAVDTTEGITLDARTKVAFIEPDNMKAIGGSDSYQDFDYGNYFGDASIFLSSVDSLSAGEVYEFMVDFNEDQNEEDEEVKITRNEATSVTVTAVDELGNIVPNYTGTVRFSSTDDNAELPEDYTFTGEDLGTHDFDLGITFKTEGTHILSINDIINFSLKGESEFEVIPGEVIATPTVNSEIDLSSPREGTYSSTTVKVSGTTAPNTELRVFDREFMQQSLTSSDNGAFEVEIENLDEGVHEIYVTAVDEAGNVTSESQRVEVTIDSTKPVIESFEVTPDGVIQAEAEVTITLVSEANLGKSSLLIEDRIFEMTEEISNPGVYVATFPAPGEAGSYDIDVVLEDAVGNEGSFPQQSTFSVEAKEEVIMPTQVTEITAVESDSRVTLTWAAAEDDTYITKYKVSYGFGPEELYLDAITFDSSTTWYVPNLENGQEYYFAIQGINSDGNEGPLSELIKASPKAPEPEMPASLEDPVILEELPATTPETGPELWLMVIASLLIVDIFYRSRKRA